jgi:hypothetical protein
MREDRREDTGIEEEGGGDIGGIRKVQRKRKRR